MKKTAMLLVCAATLLVMVTGCRKPDASVQETTVVTTMSTEATEQNVTVATQDVPEESESRESVPKDTGNPNTKPMIRPWSSANIEDNHADEPTNPGEIQPPATETPQLEETTPLVQNPPIADYGTILPDQEF